jgi:hypothetical protein
MGGGGTTSNTTVQTSQSNPWASAVPYMNTALSNAQTLYDAGGPQPFTGPRVASFTDPQQAGFTAATNAANQFIAGSQNQTPMDAYNQLLNTQLGYSQGPVINPFAQQNIANQAQQMTNSINSAFSGSGRLGSYSNAQALRNNVGQFLQGAYSNLYQQGLGTQMQAAQNAAQLAQGMPQMQGAIAGLGLQGAQALGAVGGQQQQLNQANINAAMQLYNEQQQRPYQAAQGFENAVLPLSYGGGQVAQTTGTQTSPFQTLLGLGMGGLGLMSASGGLSGLGAMMGGMLGL